MTAHTTPALLHQPICLIGAPTDVGAGVRGSSMGPEALRVAGLVETLRRRGLHVTDSGNLAGPGNPEQSPVNGYRHLPRWWPGTRWCTPPCTARWCKAAFPF